MRDYKFRGINKLTKDVWEYGAYVPGGTTIAGVRDHTIVSPGCYATEVKPETVGQFTGKHDKCGVAVYDGDLLENSAWTCALEVYFDDVNCGWFVCDLDGYAEPLYDVIESSKVIGSKHLNPELLETQHA